MQHLRHTAMTLAEVLIVLGIIGIVAAITIPTLINKFTENEYKTGYKKAYSDIQQAMAKAIQEQSLTPRTELYDATAFESEWAVIQEAFRTTKICTASNFN